ncbi:MAG TPA: hypothetical protein VNT26_14620 [Candidatus Sulfotelmatobacter sp.]|nr:hypothetical protein [Candidatus Sulfotelmatobacter sp.]
MKKRAPSMTGSRNRMSAASMRRGFRPAPAAPKSKKAPAVAARKGSSSAAARRSTPAAARGAAAKKAASQPAQNRKVSKMTVNHDQIRRWVEARGGHPAVVKQTVKGRKQSGVLRIDFPGFSGAQTLKAIPWDEWFDTFEEHRLAFLYQDRTVSGKQSRFNKLVCRK